MSDANLNVTTPAGAGSAVPVVPRSVEVGGTLAIRITGSNGRVLSKEVLVRFGDNGPTELGTFVTPTTWHCTGTMPAALPPGTAFDISVTASASVISSGRPPKPGFPPPEPIEEELSDTLVFTVRLANPAPLPSIDAFPPELPAAELPLPFTLSGATVDADANVSAVQCALDTGDFEPAENLAGNWTRWQKRYALSAGLHRFTVRASDQGGNQTTIEQFVMVRPVPEPVDAQLGSVTSWTRLEPSCRDTDMKTSLSARAFDPLWLLARQWQMGEFQGADAGTPVQARVRATSAMLSRCHLGELAADTNAQAPRFDPLRAPLETLVERRPMRPRSETENTMLPLAVEAGLHFQRLFEAQVPSKSYRAAFVARFALQPLSAATAATADEATRRFVQCMAGRALDARRLAAALREGGTAALLQDAALAIAALDAAELQQAATAWLAWYDGLFCEPSGTPADDAWAPERLEYAVTVSASLSNNAQDQVHLGAREFDDGRLDWSSFDVDLEVNLASNGDNAFRAITETVLPAPVTFRGAPAVRFWEIEDERLAYGLLPVGRTDLAHMMLFEYAGSYGNDWFVLPLTLPVGSVTRVDSLVVTDSFGVRTLIDPMGRAAVPAAGFSMWQHAVLRRPGSGIGDSVIPNLFFLPPALGQTLEGAALEEVALLRDEMANVAWAIESSTESALETSRGFVATEPPPATPLPAADAPHYRVATSVPANWIPLLPIQLRNAQGQVLSRLRRAALLQPDGTSMPPRASSQLLDAGSSLLLHDEDIPREGLQMSKGRRMSRWIDGSTWVWTAFRKRVGHGEGSSGLEFDRLQGGQR